MSATHTIAIQRGAVPLVWNQNGIAYPGWRPTGWEQINAELARMLAAASHVIYQSHFCRTSADRFLGPCSGSWEVLYNAVDTTWFSPDARGQHRPDRLTMLVAGTQDVAYRVMVALDVLARVRRRRRDAGMMIAGRLRWGGGPETAMAEARRRVVELRLEDCVTFLGPYAQTQAPDIYRQSETQPLAAPERGCEGGGGDRNHRRPPERDRG